MTLIYTAVSHADNTVLVPLGLILAGLCVQGSFLSESDFSKISKVWK